jgi:hypothetical protein
MTGNPIKTSPTTGSPDRNVFSLPPVLRDQFFRFRQRLWFVKTLETLAITGLCMAVSYMILFVADRLGETPQMIRWSGWLTGSLLAAIWIPCRAYRWIWLRRSNLQLARLVSRDQPRIGDRLIGVLELVERQDAHASPALRKAAIEQVAHEVRLVDFQRSVPSPRHRWWSAWAAVATGMALVMLLIPDAGLNSLARWALPWKPIARYTFTQLEPLPDRIAVPLAEPFDVVVQLAPRTRWSPPRAMAQYAAQTPLDAARQQQRYAFTVPPQTAAGPLLIRVGDARVAVTIDPLPRPELTALTAQVILPTYLGHPDRRQDVRHGQMTVVRGSRAQLDAIASREVREATAETRSEESSESAPAALAPLASVHVQGNQISLPALEVDEPIEGRLLWTDVEGLSAASPFRIRIQVRDDVAPTVQCARLITDQVILADESLQFDVVASDDFGVKCVGLQWKRLDGTDSDAPLAHGETLLAQGSPHTESLVANGVFTPRSEGNPMQVIELRAFCEDYLPSRERTLSAPYRLYVLDRDQHMIWMTRQLEQWQRQTLEVRDEEQRLLDRNRELLQLTLAERDMERNRQQLSQQAAAERANAARLGKLTGQGEELLQKAAENPEFSAESLEQWAKVLRVLQELSTKQMPSVANGLVAASRGESPDAASQPTAPSVSDSVRGRPEDPAAEKESQEDEPVSDQSASSQAGGALQLPVTSLPGGLDAGNEDEPSDASESNSDSADDDHTSRKLDQAIAEQEELLVEFTRVMDELKELLEQLGGSTFVKRLKAVADAELTAASEMHRRLMQSFGEDIDVLSRDFQQHLHRLANQQVDLAREVRLIQEDLVAYAARTNSESHQSVSDEIVEQEAVNSLQDLSAALARNQVGASIAEAEYWSDQLDRWAEMLVGPESEQKRQESGESSDSLPPSVVLEVMRILKDEMDLREATRVAQQIRGAEPTAEYLSRAAELRQTQDQLVDRTQWLMDQLQQIQREGQKDFGGTLPQLAAARSAMEDAAALLALPDTAGPAIAAETEAIELLLQTKRNASQGGGSGGAAGATPGGGGGESAAGEASALAGIGMNSSFESRDVEQAGGVAGEMVPAEFRSGLDAYFSALEGGQQP